jgi:hypothetical protein
MTRITRILLTAFTGWLWIGMAAATPKSPPQITKFESPIIEIASLRFGEAYVSYELRIYSDGTVRFLGKPDKSQEKVGVGEHYARIPSADLRVVRSVLTRVDERLLREFRVITEALIKTRESAKTRPPEPTPETPPPIVTGASLAMTLEEVVVGNFSPGDKVEIYADGTMHFDKRELGHYYDKLDPEELRAWRRAFESVQPAIIPQPPEITYREPPVITFEDLGVGDMYVSYKVEIYEDGTIHYYGKPGGKYGAIGDHYSRISRTKLEDLLKEFEAVEDVGGIVGEERKLHFFDLEDNYKSYAFDSGYNAITLNLHGRSKRVTFGRGFGDLMSHIWRTVNLNQWMCVPSHKGCFDNLESK